MGKEFSEVQKTLKKVGNLNYVEVRNVPMKIYADFGPSIEASVIQHIEKQVAREFIEQRLPLRGQEVEYLRGVFGLSQRDFAQKLELSHVSVLKWEKAKHQPLALINEIAVKVLVAGLLNMKQAASLEAFSGSKEFPKKLLLDYSDFEPKKKKRAA